MAHTGEPLRVDDLTWAALLGRWLDFARGSVALPQDVAGQRWKASVAPVITLQAITLALGQLDGLPEDERALGLDRAEILLRRESATLNDTWRSEPMPPLLLELMRDAATALRAATVGCAVEMLVIDPADVRCGEDLCRIAPVDQSGLAESVAGVFEGEIHLARPGTLLVADEPLGFVVGATPRAWWRSQRNAAEALQTDVPEIAALLAPFRARYVVTPRQVYRQMNNAGRIEVDVAAPLIEDPQPGQPLLVRVWPEARQAPRFSTERWIEQQRCAWPPTGLRFGESDDLEARLSGH